MPSTWLDPVRPAKAPLPRGSAPLDDNEQAQRKGQAEQDGSEVKSVELEQLIAQGLSLIERRNAFEFARDYAAELFEVETGSAWRPRCGSMVNRRALTASVIDSREFIAARRRADTEVLAPAGSRIAFTGGTDCNDVDRIWEALDKVRVNHPDMVLLHGGFAERRRAHGRLLGRQSQSAAGRLQARLDPRRPAAPFKRNDRLLELLPIGAVVFPGSGISANLADKAKKLGIPVWRFEKQSPSTSDGAA